MSNNQKNYQYRFGSPFNWIIALLAIFLIFYVATQFIRILWQLALFAMPVLLIVTLIMNRNVIFNYLKSIRNLYKRNVTMGVVATILTIIGSPLVTLFLFGQAMFLRKAKKAQKQAQEQQENKFGEYIEYEEVDRSFTRLLNEKRKQENKVPRSNGNNNRSEDNPYDKLWE